MWHKCPHGGMCENLHVTKGAPTCDTCTPDMQKPEGIAVELIDFCIRAMDTMAASDVAFAHTIEDAEDLEESCRCLLWWHEIVSLPDLVDALHTQVSMAEWLQKQAPSAETQESGFEYLQNAVGEAIAWIRKQGVDPVSLMIEKHEYNKHRPYKHGGKVC